MMQAFSAAVRNSFFSEEKKQKTFTFSAAPKIEAMAGIVPPAPEIKVFLLLFIQKKKILLSAFELDLTR